MADIETGLIFTEATKNNNVDFVFASHIYENFNTIIKKVADEKGLPFLKEKCTASINDYFAFGVNAPHTSDDLLIESWIDTDCNGCKNCHIRIRNIKEKEQGQVTFCSPILNLKDVIDNIK